MLLRNALAQTRGIPILDTDDSFSSIDSHPFIGAGVGSTLQDRGDSLDSFDLDLSISMDSYDR